MEELKNYCNQLLQLLIDNKCCTPMLALRLQNQAYGAIMYHLSVTHDADYQAIYDYWDEIRPIFDALI